MDRPVWVVKIGGSLERSPSLPAWLDLLADEGAGRLVVVPGGGSFAEAVRSNDRHWALPPLVSHRMAIVAMEQFAWMLCGLNAGLVPASSATEMDDARARGRTPVWLAAGMSLEAGAEIEASWRVSSDSLAAWLAGKLGAGALVLVKTISPPVLQVSELCELGYLDRGFVDYAADLGCEIVCLGADEYPRLALALGDGTCPGHPLQT